MLKNTKKFNSQRTIAEESLDKYHQQSDPTSHVAGSACPQMALAPHLFVCTVYTPVKMVSSVGEVNEENWVAAATMCSCPALLMLRAKQIEDVAEFLELGGEWNVEQANQNRRVQLVLKLADEVQGAEMKVKWASREKRERK